MPDDDREYYSAVLVVESDDELRSMIVGALRNYGFLVLAASDGEGALRTVDHQKSPVKVVIVGTELPDTSGIALAETLGTIHPGAHTIFVASDPDAEPPTAPGLAPGTHSFLTAPLDTGVLLETVWGALKPGEESGDGSSGGSGG